MSESNPRTTQGTAQETTSCHSCGSAGQSRKRWNDNRHAKIIDRALELLKTGSPAEDVAKLDGWLRKDGFKGSLLAGLHDADYNYPYDALVYSSHFYDPDTERNFFGVTEPTAKTETLRHFKESLARRHRDPNAIRDIAYELGLALHYLTDLSQPMHAANFINNPFINDFRHKYLEEYAEQNLDDFHARVYDSSTGIDHNLSTLNSVEHLVKDLARHSKTVFEVRVQPFLTTMEEITSIGGPPIIRFRDKWASTPENKIETAQILRLSIPRGEEAAAAFILLWVRGYESILDRLYQRFFGRAPDAAGKRNYMDHFVNDNYTVRALVREMASSQEFYERCEKNASTRRGSTVRELLFDTVFNARPTPTQRPTEEEMQGLNHPKWFALANNLVNGEEYGRRFGEHQIPGYKGLSALKA